ncbi:MAG: hypothetical protein ACI9JT_000853 [Polaribacter sp.]|jgi:hypothetical protein
MIFLKQFISLIKLLLNRILIIPNTIKQKSFHYLSFFFLFKQFNKEKFKSKKHIMSEICIQLTSTQKPI